MSQKLSFAVCTEPTAEMESIDVLLYAAKAFDLAKCVCMTIRPVPYHKRSDLQDTSSPE